MRKISRRDFVKKVGVGTAGALGLVSLGGFARLADAVAGGARAQPRPGGGVIRPLDWVCPVGYCQAGDGDTCGAADWTSPEKVDT
jgi:anaerobic selenocysteine-containing dehydrogenase